MTQTFSIREAEDASRFAENCAKCLNKVMYLVTRGSKIIVSEKKFSGATMYFPF